LIHLFFIKKFKNIIIESEFISQETSQLHPYAPFIQKIVIFAWKIETFLFSIHLAFVWFERNRGERDREERKRREVGDFSCLVRREIEKREE